MQSRVCLIGTPRCGSQYISQLVEGTIAELYGSIPFNLQEPFTENQKYLLKIVENKNIDIDGSTLQNTSVIDRVNHTLDIINQSNNDQSVVLRLFPYMYLIPYFEKIINTLEDSGFKFVIIKRNNVEEQLLSHLVADFTNNWRLKTGSKKFTDTIELKVFDRLPLYYGNIKNFDLVLKYYNLENFPVINYETAETDIVDIFGTLNKGYLRIQQQRLDNPYQIINNRDEVKDFIKKLIS